MNPAYKEILPEDAAALRINHNFQDWRREVAWFGGGLDEKDATELEARVYDECCIFCSNNEGVFPDGKCSGVYIEHVDGKDCVIAHTRGRRFTRKSRLATCNDEFVY